MLVGLEAGVQSRHIAGVSREDESAQALRDHREVGVDTLAVESFAGTDRPACVESVAEDRCEQDSVDHQHEPIDGDHRYLEPILAIESVHQGDGDQSHDRDDESGTEDPTDDASLDSSIVDERDRQEEGQADQQVPSLFECYERSVGVVLGQQRDSFGFAGGNAGRDHRELNEVGRHQHGSCDHGHRYGHLTEYRAILRRNGA